MASDAAVSEFASFFARLSRDPDLPPIIPFIMGLAATATATDLSDQEQPADGRPSRLLVRSAETQNVVVIERGSSGIEALMRELAKDGHPPASKGSIAAMPTVTVTEGGCECPICLDQFEVGGEAKVMPCKHLFHGDCVEKWLNVHGTCPVCRFTMPADQDEPEKKHQNGNGVSVNIIISTSSEDEEEEESDHNDDEAPATDSYNSTMTPSEQS